MANQLTAHSLAPLTAARTVNVNASTGSDTTGDGSSAHPWQTLAKAWADRLTYGELRAVYTVQLLGVGPFTMPTMGPSVCGQGGFFIILGDPASDTVNATGTFTGDFNTTTFTASTSAGLGADTQKGRFLYITSGNCNGVRSIILSNTDTTVTVPLLDWKTTLGVVANGNTFSIKTPATVINVPAAASGQEAPGLQDCSGGSYPDAAFASSARHWIVGCAFTGSTLRHKRSWLLMLGCTLAQGLQCTEGELQIGGASNGFPVGVGTNTKTNMLMGYGVAITTASFVQALVASTMPIYGLYTPSSIQYGTNCWGYLNGCRVSGANLGGRMEANGAALNLIRGTIAVDSNGTLVMNGGTWTFAVTSGSCISLANGATLQIVFAWGTFSGATTDATSAAIVLSAGGGRVVLVGAPTLTGVAGADLKTTNIVKANAFLAAAGDFISDMGGAETIVRV